MADQKNHHRPTPKSSLQVDVNPTNIHKTLPPSAKSADDVGVNFSDATPPVSELVGIYDSEAIDPAYQAKSHVVSRVIQEIGMGRYQVRSPYRGFQKSSSAFR